MYRQIYLSILLICNSGAFAQIDTLNQVDDLGLKQGYWEIIGSMVPEKNYCDSCLVQSGFYLNDRKHGPWTYYFVNGQARLEGHFRSGRPYGPYIKYYDNGVPMEEGQWIMRKQRGEFKRYYENGFLAQQKFFNDEGEQIDTAYFYFENGCLQKKWIYNPPGHINEEYSYFQDSCNVLESTQLLEGDQHYIYTKCGGDPQVKIGTDCNWGIPLEEKPVLKNYDGNCEYFVELEMAADGDQEILDADGNLIIDGEIKNGELINGYLYCYHEEDTKVYKYRNGKVVKHWWDFGEEPEFEYE